MNTAGKVALVTGGTGFTGRHVLPLLQARGYRVVGLGGHAEGLDAALQCDLRDAARLREIVAQVQPTHVIHLAGMAFVGHGAARDFYDVNLFGTINLLDALTALTSVPQRVLLASSANVYGTPLLESIDESVCPAPVNHYACSKLAMEHMARNYADRLPVVIVRPFNYTGVGQDKKFLVPKIISHFRRRTSYIELGNLDVARDFSDVRDVAYAYLHLLEADIPSGQTFNICSGRGFSLREILKLTEGLTGHQMEVRINPAFVRSNEVSRLTGDPTHLEEVIGHRKLIPFSQTLQWMLDS